MRRQPTERSSLRGSRGERQNTRRNERSQNLPRSADDSRQLLRRAIVRGYCLAREGPRGTARNRGRLRGDRCLTKMRLPSRSQDGGPKTGQFSAVMGTGISSR